MIVLEYAMFNRGRRGLGRRCNRCRGVGLLHAAMPDGGHAAHPGGEAGRGIQNAGERWDALGKPERVVAGKISQAGLLAHHIGLIVHHAGDPAQVGLVSRGGIAGMHAARAAAHLGAVFGESPGDIVRLALEEKCGALRAEAVGHRSREQSGVGPLRNDPVRAVAALRMERGRGLAMFEHVANERCVAINVGADLQYRSAPVAAGERHHIGLGHDARNVDRLPCQLLVAQD